MADNAVIGALRVVLGMDTAQFEDGAKLAAKSLQSFAGKVTTIAAGIGIGTIIAKQVSDFVDSLKEAVRHADELGKTAQKVGVPVEEISKLKLAADLAGVGMDSLTTGLGKLSKAMLDASQGSAEAQKPFRALGISVTDSAGNLRSVSDVISDVAGKFENIKDGAAKTATAMQLFGKSGKDLIPLLNDGKTGLDEMAKAAQNMGLVISRDTAAQSQKLNDNIKLLTLAKEGLVNMIVEKLLPALVRLSDAYVENAKTGESARSFADQITNVIKNEAAEFFKAAEAIKAFSEILKLAKDALAGVNPDEGLKAAADAWEKIKAIVEDLPTRFREAEKSVDDYFTKVTVGAKTFGDEIANPAIGKAIEDLQFKTRILKGDFDNLAKGFPELGKGIVGIDGIKTSVQALSPELQKLNDAQLAFNGAQLTQDSLLPWQLYEQQLMRIQQLMDAGKISQETYAQAIKKAAESSGQAWDLAAAKITGDLATGLKAFAGQNKELAVAAKVAAIAQATINTYTAASKALATYPPPLSYAAAAAAVVAGLGYVAQIKAQQFAHGGSFKVGGMGGVDSQMVQFMATPGEMVDVRTPGQERGGGSAQTINIQGIRPKDYYTGETLIAIIRNANAIASDGYTFVTA